MKSEMPAGQLRSGVSAERRCQISASWRRSTETPPRQIVFEVNP